MHLFVDTARSRVSITVRCPSVCLSVPSCDRRTPLGGFAAVGPADRIDCCTAGAQQQLRRSTARSSKRGQCHVVSWRRKLTYCLNYCETVQHFSAQVVVIEPDLWIWRPVWYKIGTEALALTYFSLLPFHCLAMIFYGCAAKYCSDMRNTRLKTSASVLVFTTRTRVKTETNTHTPIFADILSKQRYRGVTNN